MGLLRKRIGLVLFGSVVKQVSKYVGVHGWSYVPEARRSDSRETGLKCKSENWGISPDMECIGREINMLLRQPDPLFTYSSFVYWWENALIALGLLFLSLTSINGFCDGSAVCLKLNFQLTSFYQTTLPLGKAGFRQMPSTLFLLWAKFQSAVSLSGRWLQHELKLWFLPGNLK